jgi:ABC-type sugar transport system permease subunit/outer membrane protein assembly factor BamB
MRRATSVPGYQKAAVPNRPVLIWSSVVLVAIAAVVSVVALSVFSAGSGAALAPAAALSKGIEHAAALDSKTIVVGTIDNNLVVWQDGRIAVQKKLPYLVNAMAVLPGGKVVVGLVTGQIQVYDRQLQLGSTLKVPGRVTGLAARADGGLVVTYGSGPASSDYQVEQYNASLARQAATQVGLPTRGVAAVGSLTAFCNSKGEVGAVDATGKVVWRVLAEQSLNAIAADASSNTIYVGDIRGGISRVSATGAIVWRQSVTDYEIEALYALPNGAGVIAGAKDGSVFVLDAAGKRQFGQRLVDSPIVALAPLQATTVSAIASDGSQFDLNSSALGGAGTSSLLRLVWYVGVGVLAIAASGLALAGFGRTRSGGARLSRRIYRARLAYLLLAPAMLLMLVFSYYPGIAAFYISFTNFSLSAPTEFVGLRNFLLLPQDPFFVVGIKNMLIILATNVAKALTVPLLVAELIFWMRNATLRYWFRTAFVFPAVVPGIVAVLLWKVIWAPQIGLVNQLLSLVGLGQFQHAWLGEEGTALLAIILTGFPWVEIFAFLVYFGGLLGVNSEMYEAAAVDGANWLTRLLRIDIPSLMPQFRLVLFFTFIGSLQGFAGIFVLTGGGPGTATYVPALEMYIDISRAAEFGYASAIGFVLAAAVMALVLLRLRLDSDTA